MSNTPFQILHGYALLASTLALGIAMTSGTSAQAQSSVAAVPHAATPMMQNQQKQATDSSDPIAAATQAYRSGGIARPVVQGDFVTYPYGHSQPTLTCAVLRACIIELQHGEIVLSRIAGDTERWEITPAPAGMDGRTTLVAIKPHECDITTNLVLATDRRIYDVTLDSPPCKPHSVNPQEPYLRHVRFYYPDETVAQWIRPADSAVARIGPDVLALNFKYMVKKDRHFPWAPAQVFDDGSRVYIKLPEEARHASAPALFILEHDGSKSLINYSIVGDTYVTDRLFDRAVLIDGSDGNETQVLIERKGGGAR